eukprot:TRINITY_DN17725_c0_g1_i2.p1 TRINITY_DN17725_c0_g1~~TRINITY_DN17725_c0_g1_i2.p1  ORF type:complete len:159 (-),score=48.38 TRINITY_DN17725_c0_g1_i2:10-486(-)
MIRRPPRSTQSRSSAASDVYKRQSQEGKKAESSVTAQSVKQNGNEVMKEEKGSALGSLLLQLYTANSVQNSTSSYSFDTLFQQSRLSNEKSIPPLHSIYTPMDELLESLPTSTPKEETSKKTLDEREKAFAFLDIYYCLLYTSPSPRDRQKSRMPSSA